MVRRSIGGTILCTLRFVARRKCDEQPTLRFISLMPFDGANPDGTGACETVGFVVFSTPLVKKMHVKRSTKMRCGYAP